MTNGTSKRRDEVMRLIVKNHDMISGYLYALVRDWDLVDEAIQETTVYLCDHWNDFEAGTNFCAWIRAVARMRCREALASKQRSAQLLKTDFELIANSLTYEEWDGKKSRIPPQTQILERCIKSLPEDQRQLIEMVYEEMRPTEQIARQQQKTIEAVYKILSRIRRRLKICMERRLVEEPA